MTWLWQYIAFYFQQQRLLIEFMLPLRNFATALQHSARICLMRHGQIDDAGYCVGQADLPLNAQGLALAQRIASLSPASAFNHLFASDLQRALQTAGPIAQQLQLNIQTMPELREIHMGVFTGQRWDDLHRDQHEALANWGQHWLHRGAPGGESFVELASRVDEALRIIRQTIDATGRALVVAHAGVLRAVLHRHGGLTPDAAMAQSIAHGDCLLMD
jgi:broad specificity phosphatase PhoE